LFCFVALHQWRLFLRAGQTFLPVAVQPLADGFGDGPKRPGGGLDAVLLGELDQTQA